MKLTGELLRAHYNLRRVFVDHDISLADAADALKSLKKLDRHRARMKKQSVELLDR